VRCLVLRIAGVVVAVVTVGLSSASPAAQSAATGLADQRTPWGDPDLQGIWVINEPTPLERPDPKLDAARLAALARWFPGGETGLGGLPGVTERTRPGTREGLVTDPPNGRIPLKPSAEAARDDQLAHLTDSHERHTLWERCITRGPVLLPSLYNNGYQIVQAPGSVAIVHEMIHEYRVIPLDGRPRVPEIRQWLGTPRGHWEGRTLVVETANFRAGTILASSVQSLALRGIAHSEALKLVERFTPVSDKVMDYQLTVEDPHTYSRPWTVKFPLNREPKYLLLEYACHEGNYGLLNTLTTARGQHPK
jgi:hypothetical protein